MIDIYETYADIRAYWFDYGKVLPHTRAWISDSYHFTDVMFNNEYCIADCTA